MGSEHRAPATGVAGPGGSVLLPGGRGTAAGGVLCNRTGRHAHVSHCSARPPPATNNKLIIRPLVTTTPSAVGRTGVAATTARCVRLLVFTAVLPCDVTRHAGNRVTPPPAMHCTRHFEIFIRTKSSMLEESKKVRNIRNERKEITICLLCLLGELQHKMLDKYK